MDETAYAQELPEQITSNAVVDTGATKGTGPEKVLDKLAETLKEQGCKVWDEETEGEQTYRGAIRRLRHQGWH